ncbi:MAG: hypothetical protein ACOCP8_10465 [archaeon]
MKVSLRFKKNIVVFKNHEKNISYWAKEGFNTLGIEDKASDLLLKIKENYINEILYNLLIDTDDVFEEKEKFSVCCGSSMGMSIGNLANVKKIYNYIIDIDIDVKANTTSTERFFVEIIAGRKKERAIFFTNDLNHIFDKLQKIIESKFEDTDKIDYDNEKNEINVTI